MAPACYTRFHSSLGTASAGSAVRQVDQHLNPLAYDVVTLVAANVGDESDPASILLLRRMVQTLGGWWTVRFLSVHRHIDIRSMPELAAFTAVSVSVVLE